MKAALLEELPYDQSILPVIMKRDPMRSAVQVLLLILTTVLTCVVVPLLSPLLAACFSLDASWDQQHDISLSSVKGVGNLFSYSSCVSTLSLEIFAVIALVSFTILGLADALGMQWPSSWQALSSTCYEDMFCEPKRKGQLISRLGNTYSNFLYLFDGMFVLASTSSTLFYISDVLFGSMLISLAIFSVLWHATNASKLHYPDLWAMDACIIYLILRSLGICLLCSSMLQSVAPVVTALAYGLLLVNSGYRHLQHVRFTGPFDDYFPMSGRSRLLNHGEEGNPDLYTTSVCLYLGMPALYMIIPALLQVCFIHSTGSMLAATLTGSSLAVGWSLRMFERFVLDGCAPMGWILQTAAGQPSSLQLLVAAFVSPTAILHSFTSVTLLFGYIWVRSMEQLASHSNLACKIS